jgi:diguanylate cyclase (GGDEF)-like protein
MKDRNNHTLLENNHELLSKLKQCTNLPSPPGVAAKIIELGQDPDADMSKIASAVSMDPALTAKIFRIANSAIYARQRKTENLRQALMLFGLNGTLTLALSFSLVSSLRVKSGKGIDHNQFWRRSLTVAMCCRELGTRLGISSKEDLFLSGLLQDIGILALDKVAPEIYQQLGARQADHSEVQRVEYEALGSDHAAVGAWLLNRWNLPDQFVQAVACSHDSSGSMVADEYQLLDRCVIVSSLIADIFWQPDNNLISRKAGDRAARLLGIDREALSDILGTVRDGIEETAAMFDVDLGDTDLMQSTLDQAKEILMMLNLQNIKQTVELQKTTESLESRTRELEEETRHDGLTGLFNRAYLDQIIQEEFQCAQERGWPLAAVFIDLDHFKKVNDTYGHHAGDLVLKNTAKILQNSIRETDFVGRYGGEEFIVILPGTPRAGARIVCNRLVAAFQTKTHKVGKKDEVTVTISAGLAVQDEGVDFVKASDFIRAADHAVYIAKEKGRDQWVERGQRI